MSQENLPMRLSAQKFVGGALKAGVFRAIESLLVRTSVRTCRLAILYAPGEKLYGRRASRAFW